MKQWWCIPPKANARFFWQMEDVPSISTRPYDVRFPQICIDESSKQLHGDKLEAVPMQPGQPEREDDAYEQREMCKMFLACEPLAGKRYVKVTRAADKPRLGALHLAQLVDVHYPKVEKIVLVMDHLNTHTPALLYQTFTPAEARRLLEKLEVYHTLSMGVG